MAKIYARKKPTNNGKILRPKEETIAFLLNYSKALHVHDTKYGKFESLLN